MEIALRVVATTIGVYFFISLYSFLNYGLKHPQYFNQKYPKMNYSRFPAYIGFAILVYFGTKDGFLYFIPDTWGGIDEYGEFSSVKSVIAGLVALLAFVFLETLEGAINNLSIVGLKNEEDELWKEYSEEFMEHFESLGKWEKRLVINNKLPTLQKIKKRLNEESKIKLNDEQKSLELKHNKEFYLYLDSLPKEQKLTVLDNKLSTLRMIDEEERILNDYCCEYDNQEEQIAEEIEDYKNKFGLEALSDFKQMMKRLNWEFDEEFEMEKWAKIKVQRYLRNHKNNT